MQFKEELFWLDGWESAVVGEVTLIPPSGKSLGSTTTSKPSFFSTSEAELMRILEIDEETLAVLVDARDQWVRDGVPLEDTLPADLLVNVTGKFGFTETDVAEYIVSSATAQGDVRVLYRVVRGSNLSASSIYADRNNQCFSIWMREVQ